MRIIILTTLLLAAGKYLYAQDIASQLVNDPNVTWVAEMETYISFERDGKHSFENQFTTKDDNTISTADIIKLSPSAYCTPGMSATYGEYFLSHTLGQDLQDGTLVARGEDGEPLSEDELLEFFPEEVDTFISFDPVTFEETVGVAYRTGSAKWDWYKVNLLWYFDKKAGRIQAVPQSISPIINIKKEDGKIVSYESCDIDLPPPPDAASDYNSSDVVWAKMINLRVLDFSKAKTLKGNTPKALKKMFFEQTRKGLYRFSISGEYCDEKALETSYLDKFDRGTPLDTFYIAKPATDGGKVEISNIAQITSNEMRYAGARLLWTWNRQTRRLECRLESMRLHRASYKGNGDFLFHMALFTVWLDRIE